MQSLITASLDHLRPWMAWAQREPISDRNRRLLFASWEHYWERGTGCIYGIFFDEWPVGGCALHRRVGPGGLDLGYWLGRPHGGNGFATEAAGALTDAALQLPGIDFVQISHETANRASAAVPMRLGYDQIEVGTPGVITWRIAR